MTIWWPWFGSARSMEVVAEADAKNFRHFLHDHSQAASAIPDPPSYKHARPVLFWVVASKNTGKYSCQALLTKTPGGYLGEESADRSRTLRIHFL